MGRDFELVDVDGRLLRQIPDFQYWLRASQVVLFMGVHHVLGRYRLHGRSASFGKVPSLRTLEALTTMLGSWGQARSLEQRGSLALAGPMSAKAHARSSGRLDDLAAFGRAVTRDPTVPAPGRAWAMGLAGPFGRLLELAR